MATALKSEPTFNIQSSRTAKDFRNKDTGALLSVEKFFDKKIPNPPISLLMRVIRKTIKKLKVLVRAR